jgi:hypothetical protein
MSGIQDACKANMTRGLNVLIVVEHTVKLRVSIRIVSVVLIIVESHEIGGEIDSSKELVGERAETEMDHHGSVGSLEHGLNIIDIVSKLDGVSEDKHPWLSKVCDLRGDRVVSWAGIHDFLTDRDTNLRNGCQATNESHVTNVGKGLAALLSGLVKDDSRVLVNIGSGLPVKGS